MRLVKAFAILAVLAAAIQSIHAEEIRGKVIDKGTKEALVGATVQIESAKKAAVCDMDGNFVIDGLKKGRYTLVVRYVAYKALTLPGVQTSENGTASNLVIALEPEAEQLNEVKVTAARRMNTEVAAISLVKQSSLVVSNISAQEIKRTQDSNAGEVIRRIPGVSLIEDKFVMVRGLSQRYNNVWINGGAVPSSEADSRAFSFDIIPSAQIDNLSIVKSPSPDYPADFCGGFINITTKDIPSSNSLALSLGGNWNTAADFQSFSYKDEDNWYVKTKKPWGDLKLGAEGSARWNLGQSGASMGMVGAVNYTNEYRTLSDMQNNLYGAYDYSHDKSNYLRRSTDDQYNNNSRLGALLNFTLMSPSGSNKYELKNIFNYLTNDRYTWREGISAQSNKEASAEYYQRSRITYNGQLTGKHSFALDDFDWSASYSYANRHMPNRRRYLIDDALTTDGSLGLTSANDINIENTTLDEHIMSAAINDTHNFAFNTFHFSIKLGAYGEYRTRSYNTHQYLYNWDASNNTLPSNFRQIDMPTLLSDPQYQGTDKLYIMEEMHMRNNYDGQNTLGAGYVAANLPFGKLNIYAGLRYEYNFMKLTSSSRDYEYAPKSMEYRNSDFFPSVNTTYKFNDKHQLRLSYGKSVNRAEFREVSSSVYYDFDLAADVQGNTDLKSCYIQNLDLRYEWYPSRGEQISLAAFYKHFDNPIEWTYTVAGGTDLIYSYENAKTANNYGLELDIKKSLDFIGLKNFSWSFNGALIHSRVNFAEGSRNENRPMQGQSPYLINTGIFYNNAAHRLNIALLYNRIGKRIIGVGRSEGSTGSDDNARIPDSYEMPRNTIDLSITKSFGDHWELKANVRDLLAEKVVYKQFTNNSAGDEIEQITRQYHPGRNIGVSLSYKF